MERNRLVAFQRYVLRVQIAINWSRHPHKIFRYRSRPLAVISSVVVDLFRCCRSFMWFYQVRSTKSASKSPIIKATAKVFSWARKTRHAGWPSWSHNSLAGLHVVWRMVDGNPRDFITRVTRFLRSKPTTNLPLKNERAFQLFSNSSESILSLPLGGRQSRVLRRGVSGQDCFNL